MACKQNEAVALNTAKTKKLVEANGVVVMTADMTVTDQEPNPEVDDLLNELGNPAQAIPYLAIFPSDGRDPITLLGKISQEQVLALLKKAGPSKNAPATSTAFSQ